MKPKIYFGHPINVYNTGLEKWLMKTIRNTFPEYDIENPGEKHHQEECKRLKAAGKNAMNYFFEKVLPECRAGIFLPFRDNKWGAGIFGEAKFLLEKKCPIFHITMGGSITKINNLNELRSLSIEKTRKRIRNKDGSRKPY